MRGRDDVDDIVGKLWGVVANEEELPPLRPIVSSPLPSSLSSSSSSSIGSSAASDDVLNPPPALLSIVAAVLVVPAAAAAAALEGALAVFGAAVHTRAKYKARNHSASSFSFSMSSSSSSSPLLLVSSLEDIVDDIADRTLSTTHIGDCIDVSNKPSNANTHQGSICNALFQYKFARNG